MVQPTDGSIMRRRIGFVSNSSTTSFIIIGWTFKEDYSDPIYKTIYKYIMKKPLPDGEEKYDIDLEEEALEKDINLAISYDRNIIGIGVKNVGDGSVNSIEPYMLLSIMEEFKKFKENVDINKVAEVFYGSSFEG